MEDVEKIIIGFVILLVLGGSCQEQRDIAKTENSNKVVRSHVETKPHVERIPNVIKQVDPFKEKVIKKEKEVRKVFNEIDREIDM